MLNRPFLALPALVGALLGASIAAFAQSAPPPAGANADGAGRPPYAASQSGTARAHRRHGRVARALKGLALSPDQRTKIHGFMHAYRTSRAAGSPETRAQLVAQIEGVLTPVERSKFESRLHRARRPPAASGVPGANGPPGPGGPAGAPAP